MALKKIFKSTAPTVCYTFQCNHKKIQFMGGNYFTDIKEEIEELEKEVRLGHPMIYIDPNDCELDTDAEAKRIQKIKEDAVAEFIAKEAENKAGTADRGTSIASPVKPMGTDKLGSIVAGSTSTGA